MGPPANTTAAIGRVAAAVQLPTLAGLVLPICFLTTSSLTISAHERATFVVRPHWAARSLATAASRDPATQRAASYQARCKPFR